jgi:hypothetical protein
MAPPVALRLIEQAARPPRETPLGAAGRGLLAGLAGSLLLSVLARTLPSMGPEPWGRRREEGEVAPADPFDRDAVQRWQDRSRSPAAFRGGGTAKEAGATAGGAAGQDRATPAGALTLAQAPGPEGLAEQFAYKTASGLFGWDLSDRLRPAVLATHLAYGSLWGALYGLLQASRRARPFPFGAAYGLFVWLVGPAALVPAMKLMRPPHQEPPLRTAMLVAGHAAYGVALAASFEALEREVA